jgi:hypothetical protein
MRQHRWHELVVTLILGSVIFAAGWPAAQGAADKRPVPKTFFIPESLPGVGHPVATVDDFSGLVAVAEVTGTGTDNHGNTLAFDVDVRLMDGVYVALDGVARHGTFAFI